MAGLHSELARTVFFFSQSVSELLCIVSGVGAWTRSSRLSSFSLHVVFVFSPFVLHEFFRSDEEFGYEVLDGCVRFVGRVSRAMTHMTVGRAS